MECRGRIGELNALFLESAEHGEIYGLLNVHIDAVVRAQHPINDLEEKRRIPVGKEMCAIETCLLLTLDDLLQHGRDSLELVARRFIGHTK